jgi:hypothetical protein
LLIDEHGVLASSAGFPETMCRRASR